MDQTRTASATSLQPAKAGLPPVQPVHDDESVTLFNAECLGILRSLPTASVHAVVTDPPYAIDAKALRRPLVSSDMADTNGPAATTVDDVTLTSREDLLMNAPMLGMQSQNWHARATHSRGYADNDNKAFGEWCGLWASECLRVLKPGGHIVAFGGTRTWHRLATAIEDAGFEIRDSLAWLYGTGFPKSLDVERAIATSRTLTPTQQESSGAWTGWGTTLRPAFEPIVLARKPLEGTVAENVLEHGTGALSLGTNRIRTEAEVEVGRRLDAGRWPSNVYLDQKTADALDANSGQTASRFFWVAKPGKQERPLVDGVTHPTVKPLMLMQELVRLVTPPGGVVLDPFAGSGTTVEACVVEGRTMIGIELQPGYVPLILQRIQRRRDPVREIAAVDEQMPTLFDLSLT